MPATGNLRLALAAVGAALSLTPPSAGLAQKLTPEKDFYVTDKNIEALTVIGDTVYVGGHFTHVGRYTGPVAPLSISGGTTLPGFPEANGFVYAIEPDGSGGWFVGGAFTEIGGLARNRVAHVLPDLTVDPGWDADADAQVRDLALHGSTLYLGGFFLNVGGQPRLRLAAVSATTGALTNWDAAADGLIADLAVDGDILYVVGSFTNIGGQPRDIGAFDLTTGALTAFDPVITNDVEAVVARDGVVYVGGRFTAAGGAVRNRLAAFDAATSTVTSWDPDVSSGAILDIALADSTLYAGGTFSTVGGAPHPALVEVDLATGAPRSTVGGTTGIVYSVLVHGDSLFIGGDFTTVDGMDRRFLGGFHRNTGAVLDTPSPLALTNALAANGDTLFVGGEFSAAVGVDRNYFAAFDANTLEILPFAPDFQNIVWAIEGNAAGDTLYASGRFRSVGGSTRESLASFDLATGTLTSLSKTIDDDVYDIAVTDSLLYMGGIFDWVGGVWRPKIAAIDRVTGTTAAWDPVGSGIVNDLYAWNDTVYVAGGFATMGDSTRNNFAVLDGATADVLDWGTSLAFGGQPRPKAFLALDHPAYPQGAMFLGGPFLNLGVGLRRAVAAVHRDTGNTLYAWNPFLTSNGTAEVVDFDTADGLLYVAGNFQSVLSQTLDGVAAIDVVTGKATPWEVYARGAKHIAVADSMIFIAGGMSTVQGYYHTNVAAFRRDTTPPGAATGLTATAGAQDKRIDLAWIASPSADVKDYLVYRTTTSGADTTGKMIGIVTATSYNDTAPAYAEYFYRVYARDDAYNVGPASNEDSAVAPNLFTPPTVTTAIHQNPAASRYADVVVVSDSVLAQTPAVTVTPPAGGPAAVSMTTIPGAASAYRGPWEFTASGLYTVDTSVMLTGGQTFASQRDFQATLISRRAGGRARSASGRAALEVPGGVLREDTYIVAEDAGADSHVRFGPGAALSGEAIVELTYDPAAVPDVRKLFVARVEDGAERLLPSEVLTDRRVVRASVDRLGEFRLKFDPDFTGDNTRELRFAVYPNLPNPFRGSTTLRFDLPAAARVRAEIFDVGGRRVATLHDGLTPAGRHSLRWNGRDAQGARVAAGVYFARVSTEDAARHLKVVVLR